MNHIEDLYKQLLSDSSIGKSKTDIRNEARQVKATRFPKWKADKDKKKRLLVLTDLAIPFNPFTGEADENFNADSLFRPEWSCTDTIKVIKTHYNENPADLPKFEDRLGEKWDVSQPDVVTEKDRELFKRWRKLRVFSHNVIYIQSKILNGVDFAVAYRTNFERDVKTKEILPLGSPLPKILKISGFFNAIVGKQMAKFKQENPNASEKAEKEEYLKLVNQIPVSSDAPSNTLLTFELDLDNTLALTGVDSLTVDEAKTKLVTIKKSKNISTALNNLTTTYAERRDKYMDFFELDALVGNEDDPARRALETKFNNADRLLIENPKHEQIEGVLADAITAFKDQEETITRSVASKVLNDEVIDNLCQALAIEKPFEEIEPYLDEALAKRYADVISAIYGDQSSVDDLLMLAEDDGSEVNESTALSQEAKDITNLIASGTEDGDEVVEEVDLV